MRPFTNFQLALYGARTTALMPFVRANFLAGRFREAIWVVGDGRSGTTWLTDLLNCDGRRREMFEPFHPSEVREARPFGWFKYLRPGAADEPFRRFATRVFTGRLQSLRVDLVNARFAYSGLLIKDITAHLFLKWAHVEFPHVKKVLLLRHPFSVASSKLALKRWNWFAEPQRLLERPDLVEDFLGPFSTLLNETEGAFERLVLLWCILHMVPLRQLAPTEVLPVFYERLVAQPERELARLWSFLHGASAAVPDRAFEVFARRSRVARRSEPDRSGHTGGIWPAGLTEQNAANGERLLDAFGLGHVYRAASLQPLCEPDDLLRG